EIIFFLYKLNKKCLPNFFNKTRRTSMFFKEIDVALKMNKNQDILRVLHTIHLREGERWYIHNTNKESEYDLYSEDGETRKIYNSEEAAQKALLRLLRINKSFRQ